MYKFILIAAFVALVIISFKPPKNNNIQDTSTWEVQKFNKQDRGVHQVWCSNGHQGMDYQIIIAESIRENQKELDKLENEFCNKIIEEEGWEN